MSVGDDLYTTNTDLIKKGLDEVGQLYLDCCDSSAVSSSMLAFATNEELSQRL